MNNSEPMSWHEVPDDYEESPVFLEQEAAATEYEGELRPYVERTLYVDASTSPVRSTVAEDDWQDFMHRMHNPQDAMEPRLIEQPYRATFGFVARVDTSQTTRNKLYLGRLETRTQSHHLWGFESWTEFREHLHSSDRQLAHDIYEQLMTDLALAYHPGQFKRLLWVTHADEPRAGFWSISIDDLVTNQRFIYTHWNGNTHINEELSILKSNSITFNWKIK